MIHFWSGNLKNKLWVVSILILMIIALPAIGQTKMLIKQELKINKQKNHAISKAKPSAVPLNVDLKFTTVTISTRQIRAGRSLTVSATVKNFGVMLSGPFTIKFYISGTRTGGHPNRLIKTMPGFRLAGNNSKIFESPVTIPEDLRSQHYWLVAKVTQSSPQSIKDIKARRLTVSSANAPSTAPAISYNGSNSNDSQIRPRISSISPAQVATGQSITISGNNFGPRQGIVELGFSSPAAIVPLTITSWNNRNIVVHVPESTDALVPPGNSAVMLWVKPDGFDEHGLRDGKAIRFVSGLVPRIQSLSSQTVKPRQEIWVTGDNFLDEHPGVIRFIFHGHQFEGVVRSGDWGDQRVKVILPPYISGIIGTNGHIEVENYRGHKSRHEITFVPDLETKLLVESVMGKRGTRTNQSPPNYKEFIFTSFTHHQPITLLNDWVIKEVELRKTGGNGTCTLIPQVAPGSSDFPYQVDFHINEYKGLVGCSCRVLIEGPIGTNPF
jgi:hypothetical protein